jgi:hypothetical protein
VRKLWIGLAALVLASCGSSSSTKRPAVVSPASTPAASTPTTPSATTPRPGGTTDFRRTQDLNRDATMRLQIAIKASPRAYGTTAGATLLTADTRCVPESNPLLIGCIFYLSNGHRLGYVYRVAPNGSRYSIDHTISQSLLKQAPPPGH